MTNVESFLFEAVAHVTERDDELQLEWTLEGGICAMEGPALLIAVTDGHLGEDWYAGNFVALEDFYRVDAERDALQQRLTVQDQQVDDFTGLLSRIRSELCGTLEQQGLLVAVDAALNPTAEAVSHE